MARYEKKSTILTSNRDFEEWIAIFSNPLMGSAAMDRLVHRGIKIAIEGKSYRNEMFSKKNKWRTCKNAPFSMRIFRMNLALRKFLNKMSKNSKNFS